MVLAVTDVGKASSHNLLFVGKKLTIPFVLAPSRAATSDGWQKEMILIFFFITLWIWEESVEKSEMVVVVGELTAELILHV